MLLPSLKKPSHRSSSNSQEFAEARHCNCYPSLQSYHSSGPLLHSLILASHFSQSPEYKSWFHCSLGLEFPPLLRPPLLRNLHYTGRHNWLNFWACPKPYRWLSCPCKTALFEREYENLFWANWVTRAWRRQGNGGWGGTWIQVAWNNMFWHWSIYIILTE